MTRERFKVLGGLHYCQAVSLMRPGQFVFQWRKRQGDTFHNCVTIPQMVRKKSAHCQRRSRGC